VAALIDGVGLFVIQLVFGLIGTAGRGLGLLVSLGYYTYFEGSPSGQTFGKRVMNIRVIDQNTGGSIGYGRAAIRWVMRIVSGLACLIGYFWMLWDKEKQTWHDKVAQSYVVPTSAYPVDKWPG
jgi:uncharacterized RDD family membrane protein YckC